MESLGLWICHHCSMFYFQVFTETGQQISWNCWECGEEDGNPAPTETHWLPAKDLKFTETTGNALAGTGGHLNHREVSGQHGILSINTERSNQILSHWNYLIGLSSWTESFVSSYQGFFLHFTALAFTLPGLDWHKFIRTCPGLLLLMAPRCRISSRWEGALLEKASHPGCHCCSCQCHQPCTGTPKPHLCMGTQSRDDPRDGEGSLQLHPTNCNFCLTGHTALEQLWKDGELKGLQKSVPCCI